jgi:beta-xylosidase
MATRTWLIVGALSCVISLAGCRDSGSSTASPHVFTNPVYRHDFPDPYVLKMGATYYAYSTNSGTQDIPTLVSHDLVHWKAGKDAFPVPPRWVSSNIWAPDVYHRPDGKYVLYYAGHDIAVNHQCIGHGVSSSPAGPFIDRSARPFICQAALGGDIDPAHFVDSSGAVYLLWKNDGNCCGETTYLFSQRMSADGLRLLGKPARLLSEDASWEGNLIEAPSMWEQAGKYYLFFSANNYASFDYAVGYATCKGPQGPCKDAPENPILISKCNAAGPGGETIVTDGKGQTWFVYHAWRASAVDDPTVGRLLWLDRLKWKNGRPVVAGPTCTAQPAPAP